MLLKGPVSLFGMTKTGGLGWPRESGTVPAKACSVVEIETKYTFQGVKRSWTVRLIKA